MSKSILQLRQLAIWLEYFDPSCCQGSKKQSIFLGSSDFLAALNIKKRLRILASAFLSFSEQLKFKT